MTQLRPKETRNEKGKRRNKVQRRLAGLDQWNESSKMETDSSKVPLFAQIHQPLKYQLAGTGLIDGKNKNNQTF